MRSSKTPVVVFGLLSTLSSFAVAQPTTQRIAEDSAFFALVAEDLKRTERSLQGIDPYPLRVDVGLMTVDANAHDRDKDTFVEARRRVLQSIGVKSIVDASAQGCPGILLPKQVVERRGCPAQREVRVAVALARNGGPYFPGGVDRRAESYGDQTRSVRILVTEVEPDGAVVRVMDYVLGLVEGRWVIRDRVVLIYLE